MMFPHMLSEFPSWCFCNAFKSSRWRGKLSKLTYIDVNYRSYSPVHWIAQLNVIKLHFPSFFVLLLKSDNFLSEVALINSICVSVFFYIFSTISLPCGGVWKPCRDFNSGFLFYFPVLVGEVREMIGWKGEPNIDKNLKVSHLELLLIGDFK